MSAICGICKKDMKKVAGCKKHKTIKFDSGEVRKAIRYGNRHLANCPDCDVMPGHYHHDGCDNEVYPKCGDQLFDCPC